MFKEGVPDKVKKSQEATKTWGNTDITLRHKKVYERKAKDIQVLAGNKYRDCSTHDAIKENASWLTDPISQETESMAQRLQNSRKARNKGKGKVRNVVMKKVIEGIQKLTGTEKVEENKEGQEDQEKVPEVKKKKKIDLIKTMGKNLLDKMVD
jgi:hypothetical protein